MERVTQLYHEEIVNHYEHDLSSEPEKFNEGGKEFSKPTVNTEGNLIISKMWIHERGGMLPEDTYHISILTIHKDGKIVNHETKDRFTVQI
ncbi:MAG: hypothetical protein P8H56_10615 [Crocinitomicaceae bacterium]|nr:hypothetical protein [Crocinitomicaceae bacterium]MDG1659027.1 hypothetical protein [Crocinitomicaceae bacterium]|tara:strand:- start:5739 stop:6011 length:273 start_codon:yes stop_codon:yes gene_type:complete